jgi:hypothetical protein
MAATTQSHGHRAAAAFSHERAYSGTKGWQATQGIHTRKLSEVFGVPSDDARPGGMERRRTRARATPHRQHDRRRVPATVTR